jgi:hypothetical protein
MRQIAGLDVFAVCMEAWSCGILPLYDCRTDAYVARVRVGVHHVPPPQHTHQHMPQPCLLPASSHTPTPFRRLRTELYKLSISLKAVATLLL